MVAVVMAHAINKITKNTNLHLNYITIIIIIITIIELFIFFATMTHILSLIFVDDFGHFTSTRYIVANKCGGYRLC